VSELTTRNSDINCFSLIEDAESCSGRVEKFQSIQEIIHS